MMIPSQRSSFSSAEAAIAYAAPAGLTVHGARLAGGADEAAAGFRPSPSRGTPRPPATPPTARMDRADTCTGDRPTWIPYPGIYSAEAYLHPKQVLVDSALSPARKRNILLQWALDAYRTENEHAKGFPDERSRLHEVIDALLDLEEPQISAMS